MILFNRKATFALVAVTTILSKVVHIYAHYGALQEGQLTRWCYSFFLQDVVLLVICHLFVARKLDVNRSRTLRVLVGFGGTLLLSTSVFVSLSNACVFYNSGVEVHWANATLANDAAGRRTLLSGLWPSIYITLACIATAAFLQWPLYFIFEIFSNLLSAPFIAMAYVMAVGPRHLFRRTTWRAWLASARQRITSGSIDLEACEPKDFDLDETSSDERLNLRNWPWVLLFQIFTHAAGLAALLAMFILFMIRPHKATLKLMTWTAIVSPFVALGSASEALAKMKPLYKSGIGFKWDGRTAMSRPTKYEWLPSDREPAGFEDWYHDRRHYTASHDPLKISNLHDDVLEALGDLKTVPIRHVITILLESTRKDVFPLKKDGVIAQRFADTWDNKEFPSDVEERLRNISATARHLTGDFDHGFAPPQGEGEVENESGAEDKMKKPRGGISFEDTFVTSTYTLKSVAGSLCGVVPLIVDFNREYKKHLYQPCLPHVLDVLGRLNHKGEEGYRSYPWKSTFMQSATSTFDEQKNLVWKMGYGHFYDKEYLQADYAKFGKVTLPDVNYFSVPEDPLLDYIKDEFNMAKENDKRIMITHLTSTSHHPYGIPDTDKPDEKYKELGKGLDDLSKWVNAIGYDDRWLAKILGALDDLGVANETLVVMVGDHGLSIPENGKLPTYYNPYTINNIVPMVFSHPLLPPIKVQSSVTSRDIVPTILDLLAETGSLSKPATKAARDLTANYEGQSMIRPIRTKTLNDVANWQFTVVNPGGEQLTIRDAEHKQWVLTVPVGDATDVEWQFSADIHNAQVTLDLEFHDFLRKVETKFGVEAAEWAEQAAFIGRWWVQENWRRWRHGPYSRL
ncbi:sulfatase [Cutaneotrichosporon oleaginosum]|uniref:Sulfatase n=1 Tax=Cutaneotrichosporon oleaginosum TaxID=879819 RepID=A0A0J0XID8_9TREE|nr:sulfatase [Cutaneotrichosporon oleaginosum]KLT40866.1 sulfatase [Cutaneotrichosporon oleaginosum]TXT09274.1 hypothetical protein COLE_03208 [Cutaneotrichosporon oleaginosum]